MISASKAELILPVDCVFSDNTYIKVSVSDTDSTAVYDDWILEEVTRNFDDVSSFTVKYSSKTANKHKWNENSVVTVETFENVDSESPSVVINFQTEISSIVFGLAKEISFVQIP